MFGKNNTITSIDLSNSGVKAVIAEKEDNNKINIISSIAEKIPTVRESLITDLDQTSKILRSALYQLKDNSNIDNRSVYINISGTHLKTIQSHGAVMIQNTRGQVRKKDIDNAIKSAYAYGISLDRTAIHNLACGYTIDEQHQVLNPLNMHANKLEVDLFIISAFSNNVKNLKKVINEAGYEVNQIVASGIASASSVLKPEEKSSGVIVIDIGAGTTDIAFFKDNYLKGFEVIAKAGNKITEDLSRRLKLSLPYAEEIKKRYGCATYEADEKQDNIVLKEADNEFKNLNKNQINSIVEKSTNEILKDITGSLKKMKCLSSASCGVVLTGGTALLDGMIDKAENKLELPVRLGTPVGYTSKTNLSTPIWSTCLGLARYVLLGQDPSVEQKKIPLGSLIFIKQKIEDILTDYF